MIRQLKLNYQATTKLTENRVQEKGPRCSLERKSWPYYGNVLIFVIISKHICCGTPLPKFTPSKIIDSSEPLTSLRTNRTNVSNQFFFLLIRFVSLFDLFFLQSRSYLLVFDKNSVPKTLYPSLQLVSCPGSTSSMKGLKSE